MTTVCVSALAVLLVVSSSHSAGPEAGFPLIRGPYLGQESPGTVPEVFGEGILSEVSMIHGKITFSPDGMHRYGDSMAAPVQSRWSMERAEDGTWSPPQPSFLSVEHSESGLSFSPDGNRVYYHSRRRPADRRGGTDKDIWYRERTSEGWGEPRNLGSPVNTGDYDEGAPAVCADGTLYFSREAATRGHGPGSQEGRTSGANDIFCSVPLDGGYTDPVRLGPGVNSGFHEINPAVAPDNTYIVFTSNRPGGYSAMMNLYVSFKREDGTWTEAQCLSEKFRIDNIWFPSITPDGKYLFFSGGFPTSGGYTESHYYWVSTGAIEELRPKHSE
jgi:hypothetical protein